MSRYLRLILVLLSAPLLGLAVYIPTVLWRVSVAESECLGRSMLIPMSFNYPRFVEPPVTGSFFEKTYRWQFHGSSVVVWKQKINGLQHMYGSALAAFEGGEWFADKLFCANEFAEAFCDYNGIGADDQFDRKKDLYINRIGREIGAEARSKRLTGCAAETFMKARCMDVVENDPRFIAHYLDPRVLALNESSLGCPFLPKRNVFNRISKLVSLLSVGLQNSSVGPRLN